MHERTPAPERFHAFISYTTREEEVRELKPIVDEFLMRIGPTREGSGQAAAEASPAASREDEEDDLSGLLAIL